MKILVNTNKWAIYIGIILFFSGCGNTKEIEKITSLNNGADDYEINYNESLNNSSNITWKKYFKSEITNGNYDIIVSTHGQMSIIEHFSFNDSLIHRNVYNIKSDTATLIEEYSSKKNVNTINLTESDNGYYQVLKSDCNKNFFKEIFFLKDKKLVFVMATNCAHWSNTLLPVFDEYKLNYDILVKLEELFDTPMYKLY